MRTCKNCKKELLKRSQIVYCSLECQQQYKYGQYIKDWKRGLLPKQTDALTKAFPFPIRRYLFKKYKERCSICGWNKKHSKTGKSPLEIDYIDGDSNNNKESNLRLVCPNCHALTSNYRGFNKGKGRTWRRDRYLKTNN